MDRRTVLALTGAALMSGAAAEAPMKTIPTMATGGQGRFHRIYADAAGESRMEELSIADGVKPAPMVSMTPRNYNPTNVGWHNAPYKTFVINTTGWLEVELSDHSRHRVGPGDLMYMEDLTGKGHVTRLQGTGVTCLFLRVPDDFDVHAWAKGG